MPGATKSMAVCTVVALVLVTAYTVALGGSGWLWCAWIVLVLVTAGLFATQRD